MSLPSRERGLKFNKAFDVLGEGVAPFAGAWIEIRNDKNIRNGGYSRSLRGSVD